MRPFMQLHLKPLRLALMLLGARAAQASALAEGSWRPMNASGSASWVDLDGGSNSTQAYAAALWPKPAWQLVFAPPTIMALLVGGAALSSSGVRAMHWQRSSKLG